MDDGFDQSRAEKLARDRASFLPARLRRFDGVSSFPCVVNDRYQADAAVFYRPDELLTCNPEAVVSASNDLGLAVEYDTDCGDPTDFGVSVVRLQSKIDAPRIVKEVAPRLRESATVGLNHVLTLAQIHGLGPGTDPLPIEAMASRPKIGGAAKFGIAVVDTGLFSNDSDEIASDLERLVRDHSVSLGRSDVENVDIDPSDGIVDNRYAAHGGFIGGVIQSLMPGTEMSIQDCVGPDGVIDELSVAKAAFEGAASGQVGIVNLSLGTYVHSHGQLVALRRALDTMLKALPDVLWVCAAGNDSSEDPWYPAAWAAHPKYADRIVSVGALDTTGPKPRTAEFSNRGSWVTAWAPGVDIDGIYPDGVKFAYYEGSTMVGTLPFTGMARWSGTSFAAPHAAASIAAHADAHGMSAVEAWKDLRATGGFVVFD